MAISILSKQNTDGVSAEFPYGKIRDKIDGLQSGTPVNTAVYGDLHQFFAKLMDDGGVAFNDVEENAYDGFQYNEALDNVIESHLDPYSWQGLAALGYQNSWVDGGGALPNPALGEYRKERDRFLLLRGWVQGGASGTLICTLPVGFRPVKDFFGVVAAGNTNAGAITVGTNGEIKIYFSPTTTHISFDGIRIPMD